MTYTLITANVEYYTNRDGVEVSDRALPHLERWMAENGYIHRDQHLREQLANTKPCAVPVMEET